MVRHAAFLALSFVFLAGPAFAAVDFFGYQEFIQWGLAQQAQLHRELVTLVRAISQDASPALLWSLMFASFMYGVFHAAGPGHGKAVISAYMLASRSSVKHGIALSFVCALAQALMAIALMLVLGQLFSLAGKAMQISRLLEIASFSAVALMGMWMLTRLLRGKSSCGHDHSHDHDDHTHHHCSSEHLHSPACHHKHDHEVHEHQAAEQKTAQRSLWAMILAVGIRPCTGAVLVLLFAMSTNIFLWGVAATFAMGLGTAITVSALAAVSVLVRDTGFMVSGSQGVWRARLSKTFSYAAALALILIGSSMVWGYMMNSGRAF
ncbi:nickel/cobalt transporter [Marinomonas sp.]